MSGEYSDEDKVHVTRRVYKRDRWDHTAVLRYCEACGRSWPSITAFREGQTTRCPYCGAPVDGGARGAPGPRQTTLLTRAGPRPGTGEP